MEKEQRDIVKAHLWSLKPEDISFNQMTFESSIIFDLGKGKEIFKDYYISCDDGGIRSLISLNGDYTNAKNIVEEYCKHNQKHANKYFVEGGLEWSSAAKLIVEDRKATSFGFKSFIYDNRAPALECVGKDFHRFRTSRKYLEEDGYRFEEYHSGNLMTTEILMKIQSLNDNWKARYGKVWYNQNAIIKNLYKLQEETDFYVTLIYFEDKLIHYHSSERLNPNFVVLLDSHVNFGLDDDLLVRFRYNNFIQHWLHLKYWDSLKENDKPILYHSGSTASDSYKVQLRPSIINDLCTYPFKYEEDAKSNDLF